MLHVKNEDVGKNLTFEIVHPFPCKLVHLEHHIYNKIRVKASKNSHLVPEHCHIDSVRHC